MRAQQTVPCTQAAVMTQWPFPRSEPNGDDQSPELKCYFCRKVQSEHAEGQWCQRKSEPVGSGASGAADWKWRERESGAAASDDRSTRSQRKDHFPNDAPTAPDDAPMTYFFVGVCFGICIGVVLEKLPRF